MAVLTVRPDAGSGATTVDGSTYRTGVSESWATLVAAAGTHREVLNNNALYVRVQSAAGSNTFTDFWRSICTFDTSALGAFAVIESAQLELWGADNVSDLGDTTLEVVSSAPASNNNVVIADHLTLGSTSFGNWPSSATWSTISSNTIVLNSTGITNINKTGISRFGFRLGWDLNNSFTGTWVAPFAITSYGIYSTDNVALDHRPRLVINYFLSASEFSGSGKKAWFDPMLEA